MERVILQQNPHWKGEKYSEIYHRNLLAKLIDQLKLPHIQALTGVRRCGKSSLFRLLINHLIETNDPKEILFLNLDDPTFQSSWNDSANLYRLIEAAEKLSERKTRYLFLDEVQTVKDWQHFVKSVYDSRVFTKIFVTGSNSSLLSGDYAALLSGRYIVNQVYPFSFSEMLDIQNIISYAQALEEKPKLLRLQDSCMETGCFPEIQSIRQADLQREVLVSYFDTITMKDCIIQHGIRDHRLFRQLSLYLLSNIAKPYSYNSFGKATNTNENTAKTYLNALYDSYIVSEIQNFSFSAKLNSRPKNKAYCVDNGLINAVGLSFSPDKGRLFENLIYNELCKMGYNKIAFYNEENECDFIVNTNEGLMAIQAVYELNPSNLAREVNGIETVKKKFWIEKTMIVTLNQSDQLGDIPVVPFWKWAGGFGM